MLGNACCVATVKSVIGDSIVHFPFPVNEVYHKSVSVATATDHEMVPAKAGHAVYLAAYTLIGEGDVSVLFKSGSTAVSGSMSLPEDGRGLTPPFNPLGHVKTAVGAALNLTLDAAVGVRGHLTAFYVPE